jgi:hypothetical protein
MRNISGHKHLPTRQRPLNVSAIAREHGVSRSTIRRRIANGWTPPVGPQFVENVEILPPPASGRPVLAATLIALAIGIATLAVGINMQTGWHFGTSPVAAMTFSSLSVGADILALTLPATAAGLWHIQRRLLAVAAWAMWSLAATLAALASLGFVELHTSDTVAGRQAVVAMVAGATEQRQSAIEAARSAANAATEARKAECVVRGGRCRDREADERTALQALNTAIAVPVPEATTIADGDPQMTGALRLATWAGLKVTAGDVVNVRLALMAALPNIAGLVLAFGMALRRGR